MRALESFERIPLGLFPTPVHRLDHLSRLFNVNLFIKRDDLTGLGLGGNKVRKLEYLLADARRQGARVVFTTGGAQSNHAMLTAAAAGRLGLRAILVLKKRGVTACAGNQYLERLMGTEVVFVDTDDYADIYREMDRIGGEIGEPYYKIPCGGSNALGCLGYVRCAREIAAACRGEGCPSVACGDSSPLRWGAKDKCDGPRSTSAASGCVATEAKGRFDHIICAEGSGGTLAGLALGAKLYLPGTRVHGMMVDDDPFEEITPRLMRETAALMELDVPIDGGDFALRDLCGPGYAIPSEAGNAAVALMAAREGIFLDPVYTGKAFAGLIEMAREGAFAPDENVLFVHTGGAGGLFAECAINEGGSRVLTPEL